MSYFSDITESGAFTRLGMGSFLFHLNNNRDMKSFRSVFFDK